jgi:hypothetical protein
VLNDISSLGPCPKTNANPAEFSESPFSPDPLEFLSLAFPVNGVTSYLI